MIDRKALWISLLVVFAMIAADFWRLSLLPDWHYMAVTGPADSHTVNGFMLLVGPAGLLLFMAVLFARKWFASGPEENVRPWRKWSGLMLLSWTAIVALMQAFIIARSLGFVGGLDRLTVAHGFNALMGILIMVLGNMMPKLPWLTMRFRPLQLDPWQWNRQLRFMGRLLVGIGAFIAIGGFLLPKGSFLPFLVSLWLATFVAGIWHRARVRREPSPRP
jgi:hypothetical protein